MTSSAFENQWRADDHCTRTSQSSMKWGRIRTCWTMFSGMVWFVAMSRIPCFSAAVASPRPAMMCDWKWMTSGLISRVIFSAFAFTRHGSMNRSHGCGYQRQL